MQMPAHPTSAECGSDLLLPDHESSANTMKLRMACSLVRYEEDDYVPPSVVSTARRTMTSDHATQVNAVSTGRQTAAQINGTLKADN
jgi:hypothetical protein